MSNFRSKAFNPASKRVEVAEYCDDYYGRHRYGIRFDDGCVHPEAQCGIDAAATAIDSLLKERDALQARVKELEKDLRRSVERDSGGLAPDGTPWKQFAFQQAEKRGRTEQERDEAYERAAGVALSYVRQDEWRMHKDAVRVSPSRLMQKIIADAIRRLASGPEKEG